MKHLFEYMNYRDYLRDSYGEKKRDHPFYSFRLFSQKAGFTSPNFLKLVIDAKRNLSKESVFKFSKALSHGKKEAEYFENLVFFNQSKTLEEKNAYLSKLMKYRRKTDPRKIEESEYSYYSEWYHPVVRELVTAVNFKGDYKTLGRAVTPPLSPAEAEKSVKLLLDLSFIEKTDTGRYTKSAATLTTGPIVRSIAVANYHKAMMQRASESIERFPASQRDISSLTLSVSGETMGAIIEKLREFRKELLELAEADKKPAMAVQVNFQLFPLSAPFNSGEGRP
jgi:uncharacterized protein (TIGR02147 family)